MVALLMPAPIFPGCPNAPVVQPNSGLTFPWAFMQRQSHEASWGGAGQRVVERMIIPFTNYWQPSGAAGVPAWQLAQSELCGYAYVDPATNNFVRLLPWKHPMWPHLFVDAEHGISSVKLVGRPTQKTIGPNGPFNSFLWAILTLVFTERNYLVSGGTPIAGNTIKEQPFVEFVDKGSAEYIQQQTGAYQYDPTDPAVVAAGLAGQRFKAGLAVLDTKDTLVFIWRNVPHAWIHNGAGIPSGILHSLGKVNNLPFFGLGQNTLLYDSHDKKRVSYPILPINGDITTTWAWDVTLYFKFKDPIHAANSKSFGWMLAPAPQAGPDNFWYTINSAPADMLPGGASRYVQADFSDIFKKAQ